jgi:hypothetical protein
MQAPARSALCAALLPAGLAALPAVAGDLNCVVETRCQAAGCEAPDPPLAFGLRIDGGGVQFLTDAGAPAGFGLPVLDAAGPEGMQLFAGPDGNGHALLSLRRDGAVTLSVHAGRMAGAPNNQSTLAMGRCGETE